MFYKIVVFAAIAMVSLEASAQRTIVVDDKVLQLKDTVPRSKAAAPIKPITAQQLAVLLKSKSMLDSASAPRYSMIVVKPDMKNLSTFPVVDPTKKPGYIADDMPNGHRKIITLSEQVNPRR